MWEVSWLLLLLGLILIAFIFLRVIALVGTITMVKKFKFSVEDLFDHDGRNCWCHSNVFCFKVFKEFFRCDLTINGELVFFGLNRSVKTLLIFIEQSQKKNVLGFSWDFIIFYYVTMWDCFQKKYKINMQNYICVGSWQMSQDTTQTIFALDSDGWFRIWLEKHFHWILTYESGYDRYQMMIVCIQYLWILLDPDGWVRVP